MKQEILGLARSKFGLNATIEHNTMPAASREGIDLDDEPSWKLYDALTEYQKNQPLFDMQISWPEMHIDQETTQEFTEALLGLQIIDVPEGEPAEPCVAEAFYIPGSLAAMSVTLSEHGIADRERAVEIVRDTALAAGVSEDSLHMGGRPVVSVQMNRAVKDAGWNRDYPVWNLVHRSPILLSMMISVFLTLIMLRSIRLAVLVQLVSMATALAAMSLVPPTGGSMNMVLAVMPTLLMVLTTSASIHLANYWMHSGVTDATESVHRAAATAWTPCILASGTTAVGMASLASSSLVPVRDFGIYSAVGCAISFGAVLYFLPSLMLYWRRIPPDDETLDTHIWHAFGAGIARHHRAVSLLCGVVAIGCGLGLMQFRTETKVIRYFPENSRLVRDYEFLEQNLAGIVSVDTIIRFDADMQHEMTFMDRARKVMEIQQSLREHPEVSGTLSLSSFLDLAVQDTANMSRIRRLQVRRRETAIGQRIHDMLLDPERDARGVSKFIAVAEEGADWREAGDQALNRPGDELWRITCQASVLSDYDLGQLTAELDAITRRQIAVLGSPGTGHIVTGLIPIFLRTQQAVLESLIRSFALAFCVIAVVLMIYLRNPLAALLTMLPNLMPVVVMFGLLSWLQVRVDIGTMITASIALGIAVDGTLHLVTWFRQSLSRGVPRHQAVAASLEHCGPALWQTSNVIGLGMLALLPVELLLISRFGWIMSLTIVVALFCDLVLLPALLAGPLGAILERQSDRSSSDGGAAAGEGSSESRTLPITESSQTHRTHAPAGRPHWNRSSLHNPGAPSDAR